MGRITYTLYRDWLSLIMGGILNGCCLPLTLPGYAAVLEDICRSGGHSVWRVCRPGRLTEVSIGCHRYSLL